MSVYLLCLSVVTLQLVFALVAVLKPTDSGVPYEKSQVFSFLAILFVSYVGELGSWAVAGSYLVIVIAYWLYWTENGIPTGGFICRHQTEDSLDAIMFSPMDVDKPKDNELFMTALLWLPYAVFNFIISIGKGNKNGS